MKKLAMVVIGWLAGIWNNVIRRKEAMEGKSMYRELISMEGSRRDAAEYFVDGIDCEEDVQWLVSAMLGAQIEYCGITQYCHDLRYAKRCDKSELEARYQQGARFWCDLEGIRYYVTLDECNGSYALKLWVPEEALDEVDAQYRPIHAQLLNDLPF